MSLSIYNTLSRKKEVFSPIVPGEVKMYLCGPTVYGLLHVGNFRGAIVFNFVRNWLEHLGFKVKFIYNYTDVDDKIIEQAKKEGCSPQELSERYIAEFVKDFSRLKLRPHDLNPRVTETMPEIVEMISELIQKEKAYPVLADVNYSVRAFADYGKLSNRNIEELMAGTRVERDHNKKDPMDFALWKGAKPGEPSWPSPWGNGRPGWHIECSAMIRKYLGERIDIHGGGLDLLFPHHENEIAQSEGCVGPGFVNYWMHNNMINFAGSKMSKSLGNLVRAREFMDLHHPEVFKFMMMNVHYRSVLDLSDEAVDLAVKALARIYSAMALAESLVSDNSAEDPQFEAICQKTWSDIELAANDDFNSAEGFARIFELIRQYNSKVKRGMKTNPKVSGWSKSFLQVVRKFGAMMSLLQEPASEFLVTLDNQLLAKLKIERSHVEALVQKRAEARAQKDFAKSDELRAELTNLNISVADLPEGSFWEVTK